MFECIQISLHNYNVFCHQLKNEIDGILSLELFKNSSIVNLTRELSKRIFCNEIHQIISSLENPKIAISAFDIPISDDFDEGPYYKEYGQFAILKMVTLSEH